MPVLLKLWRPSACDANYFAHYFVQLGTAQLTGSLLPKVAVPYAIPHAVVNKWEADEAQIKLFRI